MIVFLVISASGIGYLAFQQFRQSNATEALDSTNRVLRVYLNYDAQDGDSISDYTQIQNALKNGGMIIIDMNNLDPKLNNNMKSYGASDSTGKYYILGALLNYIASEGWELADCPGISSDEFYYVK